MEVQQLGRSALRRWEGFGHLEFKSSRDLEKIETCCFFFWTEADEEEGSERIRGQDERFHWFPGRGTRVR
jgi:hypothetical protein